MTAGGQVWQPYLRANLWRDWGAEANTVYSGTDVVPLVSQVTLLELGGGVTGRINANVSSSPMSTMNSRSAHTDGKRETAFEARLAPDIRGDAPCRLSLVPGSNGAHGAARGRTALARMRKC